MAKKKIDCPTCGGSGEVPGRYTSPATLVCPTCGGSGKIDEAEVAAVVAADEPAAGEETTES